MKTQRNERSSRSTLTGGLVLAATLLLATSFTAAGPLDGRTLRDRTSHSYEYQAPRQTRDHSSPSRRYRDRFESRYDDEFDSRDYRRFDDSRNRFESRFDSRYEELSAPGGYGDDFSRSRRIRGFENDEGFDNRGRLNLRDRSDQIRYRPSFDSPNGLNDRFDDQRNFFDRIRNERSRDQFDRLPVPQEESEVEKIQNRLTARYQNPVVARFLRATSANEAVNLYQEISRFIDQRHLEPTTYAARVRRATRHLIEAVRNPAFASATGLNDGGFRADALQHQLERLLSNSSVTTSQQATESMYRAMQFAEQSLGISPSVVAYEYINAATDSLDKYSAFEPQDPRSPSAAISVDTKKAGLDDEVVGIGVEIKEHEDGLLIRKTLRGGPAAEKGLKKGDIITSVAGRDIRGRSINYSVDLIGGAEGTSVQIGVRRGSRNGRVTLQRRRIQVLSVNDVQMIDRDRGIGYIKLDKFSRTSATEVDQALMSLHNQGMKSLVFDVRGNPGGLLNICVDICNKFIPCGTIVSTRGRLQSDNSQEVATFERTWKTPLVVLTDGDSASASEIFAAAIQENERGVVIGEKSYGKGTVQTHFPLPSGQGNLRLTTAKFYSPEGREMAGTGVTPDVRVIDRDADENGDRVLDRATQIVTSPQVAAMATAKRCRVRNYGQTGDISGMDATEMTTVIR